VQNAVVVNTEHWCMDYK